jgi:hydrogenase maturation protein HypF
MIPRITEEGSLLLARIKVSGTVQGVGFRPFVYCLAQALGVRGVVSNQGGSVAIIAVGDSSLLNQFTRRLRDDAPPLAVVEDIQVTWGTPQEEPELTGFNIVESSATDFSHLRVPFDTATCDDCLAELSNPADRRYRYPFINCTNCGPRFTIIDSLPYDRPATSMSCFPMCTECQAEYDDPANRRFHAQPNACWECGPVLWYSRQDAGAPRLRYSGQDKDRLTSIDESVELLGSGGILAVKGLGGFHLACDATNSDAVRKLRQRKRREDKPFALMFQNEQQLRNYCRIDDQELKLVTDRRRPIVLVKPADPSPEKALAGEVSGGLDCIGAMLPCTPLQHILMTRTGIPLVMTSANLSEEPICIGNREATNRLADLSDGFLLNNRDIRTRFDDSVLKIIDGMPALIRRSRSFAPEPLKLEISSDRCILAVGAQLKNTFTILQGETAFISQHIGDMHSADTSDFFEQTIEKFRSLFHLTPEVIACDLHPDYRTTRLAQCWSEQSGLPLIQTQHHHAHIASCMAEHGVKDPVIGVAFDGIGYGADGTVWGGELLLCDLMNFRKLGGISQVSLPGGEAAVRNPWRMLLSYALELQKDGWDQYNNLRRQLESRIDAKQLDIAERQCLTSLNAPRTSSCGRLFDAVASLLGLCDSASYEGQAAMLLESCAAESVDGGGHSAELVKHFDELTIDGKSLIADISHKLRSGWNRCDLALWFHQALAAQTHAACVQAARQYNVQTVCLSGGVFQNKLLSELLATLLRRDNLNVLMQTRIPANDGGLSLGQAAIASVKGTH